MKQNRTVRFLTLACASLFIASTLAAKTETYVIDTAHSSVAFKIRHLLTKVPGQFGQFSGKIHLDRESMENSHTKAEIKVASVDTQNEKRDKHLLNDDFFDEPKHPSISFESREWQQVGENKFKIVGDLSIMGAARPVTLDAELLGFAEDRQGNALSAWEATTSIKRSDWGIDHGMAMVGDDVDIEISIEARLEEEKAE